MNRRGVSPVVATVLLLVLTVIIGSIIFAVVIPFVKDSLGSSKMCLDVFEGTEFPQSKFNCYNATASSPSGYETGFSVKIMKEGITGVRVSMIDANGNSDVFDIPGQPNSNIRMVGGTYDESIEFPTLGGQRSYVANKRYIKAELHPITSNGETCNLADSVEFAPCFKDVVL